MSWVNILSTSLIAALLVLGVAGCAFAFLFPTLMRRLPTHRLSKLETEMSEVLQSFDGLMSTWKRFRNAEGMRELRESRKSARTVTSAEAPQSELQGAAWKEQARRKLGAALHNPRAINQLHEQAADHVPASDSGK